MNRQNRIISLSMMLCVVTMLGVTIGFAGKKAAGTKSLEGKPAPDIDLKTLDGKSAKLSEQKGSVVLMDYWATWCGPCRQSLPHVNEIAADKELAGKGLKVWAINSQEQDDKVKQFVTTNKYTFTVPLDSDGDFGKKYMVEGIPTTVLVGRDGTVKKVFIGFGPDLPEQLKKAVDSALAEKANPS